jgi:transposase
MSKSSPYVGLDVSLKETSICAIGDVGKTGWRGRTESTSEAIALAVKQHAPHAVRIGLESGQLSSWLFHELKEAGLPVICVDARHAKGGTVAEGQQGRCQRRLRSDADHARGIAYAAFLKTFGRVLSIGLRSQFPGRDRAAIDGDPILAAIIEPTLRAPEAMRAPLLMYHKAVIQRARGDGTAASVNTGRRHGGCLGLYGGGRRPGALQAIIISGSALREARLTTRGESPNAEMAWCAAFCLSRPK